MRYSEIWTPTVVIRVVVATWVYAMINSTAIAVWGLNWQPNMHCVFEVVCSSPARIALSAQSLSTGLPMAIIYVCIFKAVRKQKLQLVPQGTAMSSGKLHDYLQILATFSIVVGIFFIAMITLNTLLLYSIGQSEVSLEKMPYAMIPFIIFGGSSARPAIYCWRMTPFRMALKQCLRCTKQGSPRVGVNESPEKPTPDV